MRLLRARLDSMASRATGWSRLVTPALLVADITYVVGIVAPMMSVEQFWVFTETFSLITGALRLFTSGEVLLGVIVVAFSVVFPVWKLWTLHRVWRRTRADEIEGDRRLTLLVQLGRWSMLDVFLVAVVAAIVKLGALVEVQVHAGIYFFATSVIITMVLGHQMPRLARQRP